MLEVPRFDVALTRGTVVNPPAASRQMTVGIRNGLIAGLLDPTQPVDARTVIDCAGRYVLPGAIDPHVHIGYSGYAGMPLEALAVQFGPESASALLGGVTSMVITYRNGNPYDGLFETLRSAGEQNSRIDFAYSLGITNDEHLERISHYYDECGVTSFKFYMAYRGEEAKATGNVYNRYDDGLLFCAMEQIATLKGAVAMVHAENVEIINRLRQRLQQTGRNDLAAWSECRPPFTEAENIRRALYLAEQVRCPVYVPHLSSAQGLDAIIEHRNRRSSTVTVETCPQYLTHTKDSGYGLLAKVNPPLRDHGDSVRLWNAVAAGEIDTFGTDHCAVPRREKGPDIWAAVPGFPGMATMLPVLLQGVNEGKLTIERVAEICSVNTARIFGLHPQKGSISIGSDADVVVVDLDKEVVVDARRLQSLADFSLYDGQSIRGWPVLAMARGKIAMQDGEVVADPGSGRYLFRTGRAELDVRQGAA